MSQRRAAIIASWRQGWVVAYFSERVRCTVGYDINKLEDLIGLRMIYYLCVGISLVIMYDPLPIAFCILLLRS